MNLLQEKYPVKRFVFFGPESTGKSTLCKQLAEYFQEPCNDEFMRTYLQEKWDKFHKTCEPEDILPIARGQMDNENRLVKKARKFLFSDTNLLQLAVYSQVYYHYVDEKLMQAALQNHYDLYFLTYIDVPWEKDDLRDKPGEREEMFEIFRNTLEKYSLPYVVLKGNKRQRFQKALEIIKTMDKNQLHFSPEDIKQIQEKGLTLEQVLEQIQRLNRRKSFRKLVRPATLGDGIIRLNEEEKNKYKTKYEQSKRAPVRFVPASGAATRMFKDLFVVLNEMQKGNTDWEAILKKHDLKRLKDFASIRKKLAFNEPVEQKIQADYPAFETMDENKKNLLFVEYLLSEKGLNFARFPKALIPFHKYGNASRTAFEEHIVDAQVTAFEKPLLHFTVAPDKKKMFDEKLQKITSKNDLEINFSFQDPATDTLMLDHNGKVVRTQNGRLAFRPGGHGSLLKNLQELESDRVFVKNIDNVQKDEYKAPGLEYFKILSGMLIDLTERRNQLLAFLTEQKPGKKDLKPVENFLLQDLGLNLIAGYDGLPASHQREYLFYKLNRPVRVAGMVRNSGQPGGGPFWIEENGEIRLQIVEKSEIDINNPEQNQILQKATHFNPVFMALNLTDYQGKKFHLQEFSNPGSGFVSLKKQEGKDVWIYEHPGLWNGSMEHWITIFVEVPQEVFSPVKEFYDLTVRPHV